MAQPFLRDKSCAALASLGDRQVTSGLPVDHHATRALRAPLARERGKQLILPIAGDPGYSKNFTTFDFDADIVQSRAMRIVRLEREPLNNQPRCRKCAARLRL